MDNEKKFKDEINRRLESDLWNLEISKKIVERRKQNLFRKRIIAFSSSAAVVIIAVTVSLFFTAPFYSSENSVNFAQKTNTSSEDSIYSIDELATSDYAEMDSYIDESLAMR